MYPVSLELLKKNSHESIIDYKSIILSINERNESDLAKSLFENLPQNYDVNELIECLFQDVSSNYNISVFLEAILLKHSLEELRGVNHIKSLIILDRNNQEYTLKKSDVDVLFEKNQLDNDQQKACYDLAFSLNHPYMIAYADTAILAHEYSINFLWVNLNPQDRVKNVAENIFGDGLNLFENAECLKNKDRLAVLENNESTLDDEALQNWKKIKETFTYRLSKWAEVNECIINLWYDSSLVTAHAKQRTEEMLKALSVSRRFHLELRDIRNLNIKPKFQKFLHPALPVYFRVDLLKVFITDELMSANHKYFVVTDIDVKPMSSLQLFDRRTLDFLNKNGYVFNRNGFTMFENSFFIFNQEIENLKSKHKKSMFKYLDEKFHSVRSIPRNQPIGYEHLITSQTIFLLYHNFKEAVEESYAIEKLPRKAVDCPLSQFASSSVKKKLHQSEISRFIKGDMPYTRFGRNYNIKKEEGQIKELIGWKSEPLE